MVYGASRLVLRRNVRIRVVLPALVGAQVLLHAWLVTLSGHGTTHGAQDGPLGLGWPMLLAHLAAGAVAALAWALRRRAVDVLLAWLDPARAVPPLLRERAPAAGRRGAAAARPRRRADARSAAGGRRGCLNRSLGSGPAVARACRPGPTRDTRRGTTMTVRRTSTRAAAVAVATGAVVAMAAAPASAHVTVSPDTTAAGSYAVLTFALGHGCDGSPTTRLRIAFPEEIPQPTPTRHPLWQVETVEETLDEPITDSHGNQITERVSEVVYTSRQPLEDGVRDSVAISVQLPDLAGETLTFPVVQECVEGESPWTETAAEGQDPDELDNPAPPDHPDRGRGRPR
ncbi:YcnI family protein [Nocardioides sp. TF02-7]|uniref:YcnI family protein n=1 Tax=Nocardioides sp. TF02-7 TaxID=2917724 RepID=UPI001F051164|nr:YcnI family protein [Nocardioides sp. TF02-7]UMG93159.1 YcnI family protein [Nocardioides sp. TF02-7]